MNSISKSCGLSILLGAAATASWAAPVGDVGAVHPVVDVESGFLLGASVNGRWIKPEEAARALKGGERYRVYGSRRLLGSSKGTRPKSEGAPCDETLFSRVTPNFGAGQIAIGAAWNALPRTPRPVSTTQPAYVRAVADLLRKNGIARPVVNIAQVWRVDLDGDGSDEVLISATRHKGRPVGPNGISPQVQAGDYSLVLMRKVVRGHVVTTALAQEIHARSAEFSAPNAHTLAAVLDANGDGKMEVIVRSRYYEGSSTAVFEVRGDAAHEVLSEGCGA